MHTCACKYIKTVYRRRKFSQTSDSLDKMKSRGGKSQRREEKRRRKTIKNRSKKRKSQKRESLRRKKIQKKEDPGARKGRKVAKHSVFPMICGSGGSKSRLAKAAGAEPAGQMSTLWWREAHLQVKELNTPHVQSTFRSCNVEKAHAVVARSSFRS